MIIEGKKKTAFDLLEAAMKLSDLYHKNNSKRFVSVYFHGHTENIDVSIFEEDKHGKYHSIESLNVYLDDADYGGTFEAAFNLIEEEMAKYE